MGFVRSEEEVNELIEDMKSKTKGKYITQGVSFNKESARQMELLKFALMYATSFSGLGKEMLAAKYDGLQLQHVNYAAHDNEPVKQKNVGNFLI